MRVIYIKMDHVQETIRQLTVLLESYNAAVKYVLKKNKKEEINKEIDKLNILIKYYKEL